MPVATRKTDRTKIMAVLKRRPVRGATSDEIEQELNLPHQTAAARLAELKGEGQAVQLDRRRKTRAGGLARPYRLTMLGARN